MESSSSIDSYKLKQIRYQKRDVRILMQNENGPCPLIAAANCLLLRDLANLPVPCKLANNATLNDVVNMLAEYAIATHANNHTFYIDELMQYLPKFQYGMDVNPKLTSMEFEYTAELTAFESLNAGRLLHGWLADPESEVYEIIGKDGYNQVMDRIVLHGQIDNPQTAEETKKVHEAHLMQSFLEHSSHQLTSYGLSKLWETITDNQVCVLFRNNHYATVVKHDGNLYLLATDCGYGESPEIVWERLDMVDGDTEFYNSDFNKYVAPPMTSPVAPQIASDDVHLKLALHMSLQGNHHDGGNVAVGVPVSNPEQQREAADRMLAIQLQGQTVAPALPPLRTTDSSPATAATNQPSSPQPQHPQEAADRLLAIQLQGQQQPPPAAAPTIDLDAASYQLARQLQQEENRRRVPVPPPAATTTLASSKEKCCIM